MVLDSSFIYRFGVVVPLYVTNKLLNQTLITLRLIFSHFILYEHNI